MARGEVVGVAKAANRVPEPVEEWHSVAALGRTAAVEEQQARRSGFACDRELLSSIHDQDAWWWHRRTATGTGAIVHPIAHIVHPGLEAIQRIDMNFETLVIGF